MTEQEVFDKVVVHLTKQGEASSEEVDRGDMGMKLTYCKYRAVSTEGKTLSCAIGCLIPSELYQERFEGHPIVSLLSIEKSVGKLFIGVGVEFLADLQWLHDRCALARFRQFRVAFLGDAVDFAKRYSLSMPKLENG